MLIYLITVFIPEAWMNLGLIGSFQMSYEFIATVKQDRGFKRTLLIFRLQIMLGKNHVDPQSWSPIMKTFS